MKRSFRFGNYDELFYLNCSTKRTLIAGKKCNGKAETSSTCPLLVRNKNSPQGVPALKPCGRVI
jgi:hypothetical protein